MCLLLKFRAKEFLKLFKRRFNLLILTLFITLTRKSIVLNDFILKILIVKL